MNLSTDIAIIGSGWAGVAAALEARAKGLRVMVLQKGAGSTSLSSGAIDLADSPDRTARDDWNEHLSIQKNIHDLIRKNPSHPYALLSEKMGEAEFFEFLKKSVLSLTKTIPLTWSGDLQNNRLQATPFGTFKPTALVQASMAEANLLSMNRAKLLVMGFHGYAGFNSRFIKEALRLHLESISSIDLDIPGLEGKSSLTPFEIATRFDQEEIFIRLKELILSAVQGKNYTHLFLPPVMGILHTDSILQALQKITGLQVAETLATPMSIPGYRLSQAMGQVLKQQGVETIEGTAVVYEADQRRIKSVGIQTRRERIQIQAKSFVLASGKFIGGGISRKQNFKENLFDLPVFSANSIFKAGVRTNEHLQPLNSNQEPAFENLFAAGSVLAGYESAQDHTGSGVAIVTGTCVGNNAASF